jgi:V/A-type H+-transporting ATPase subunit G/H
LGHEKTETVSATHSEVESIVSALGELEKEIDSMNSRVDEMKKRLMARSNEQVEKLKQELITMANEQAKKIVDSARAEAEAESKVIAAEAEKSLLAIKNNIDSSFGKAVDSIVRTVLGAEQEAPKAKKPRKKAEN